MYIITIFNHHGDIQRNGEISVYKTNKKSRVDAVKKLAKHYSIVEVGEHGVYVEEFDYNRPYNQSYVADKHGNTIRQYERRIDGYEKYVVERLREISA